MLKSSNFKDLDPLAKETAVACMEKSSFLSLASATQSLSTQNSNGEVMVIPAAYLRAVRLQRLDLKIDNLAKISRGVLK